MHIPVLLKEVLYWLDVQPNRNYIDCTLGEGGHALAILSRTEPDGKVLGIDWSREAIERVAKIKNKKPKIKNRLILVHDNFANLNRIVEHYKFKPIHGILLDLGLSSWLLEESGRGFSFLKDEPLDMRYSAPRQDSGQVDIPKPRRRISTKNLIDFSEKKNTVEISLRGKPSEAYLTAAKIVNEYSQEELARIFEKYGQERYAQKIARRICQRRLKARIETTGDLVKIIKEALPPLAIRRPSRLHPATRVFQALRIAVNDELENLKKALLAAENLLKPGGRIVVISYHSLEDRIVKRFFLKAPFRTLTKKPVRPSPKELKANPRARSAKLRAYQKQ